MSARPGREETALLTDAEFAAGVLQDFVRDALATTLLAAEEVVAP